MKDKIRELIANIMWMQCHLADMLLQAQVLDVRLAEIEFEKIEVILSNGEYKGLRCGKN